MIETPQIQSILSSECISDEEAKQILSKFLVEQKKYFEDVEADVVHSADASGEDYFDIDDEDNVGSFEEVESRLEGILRSLSGIKKMAINAVSVAGNGAPIENCDRPEGTMQTSNLEGSESNPTPVKEENDKSNGGSVGSLTGRKKGDKDLRRAEKKAKRSAKKERKETKRAMKKAEKEAKREAKNEKKARKQKRKAVGESNSSVKRLKKEE